MKAVNDYIVIEKIKEQKTTSGGLLLTDNTDIDNRYKKAKVISTGNDVAVVSKDDIIYYDAVAGHDIFYDDIMYRVIRARDIVIVE